MTQSCDFAEPVTVWHFLTENVDTTNIVGGANCVGGTNIVGGAVYHAVVYDAAVTTAEHADAVRRDRHSVAELQGFLFPTGHILPVTPAVGRDFIARGDHTAHETPTAAAGDGVPIYLFHDVIRPPRLRDGRMVEWVQFTANGVV